MAFWTTDLFDPKVSFRFKVIFKTNDGFEDIWYAVSAGQPSLTITSAEAKFLRHTANFPTSYKWGEVDVTLVDTGGPKTTSSVMSKISKTQIQYNELFSMSKQRFLQQFNQVQIISLDSKGKQFDKWTLFGAFPSSITFGDYSYNSDNLLEIKIKFKFDFAKFEADGQVIFDPTSGLVQSTAAVTGVATTESGNGTVIASTNSQSESLGGNGVAIVSDSQNSTAAAGQPQAQQVVAEAVDEDPGLSDTPQTTKTQFIVTSPGPLFGYDAAGGRRAEPPEADAYTFEEEF